MSLVTVDRGPGNRVVLVVDSERDDLATMLEILQEAGFQASGAIGFEDGRRMLKAMEPLVLISSVRLGSYNGLHLVARARISHPELSAIVTHHVFDPVLEAEARRQDAAFLVIPCSTAVLLDVVRAACDAAARPWRHRRQIIQS